MNVQSYTQIVHFQIILHQNGTIQFRYHSSFNASKYFSTSQGPANHVFALWPRPFIGVVLKGISDSSSVAVPWNLLDDGTTVTLEPVPGCPVCGLKGICNLSTRQCTCEENFTGVECEQCIPGKYGSNCVECPVCEPTSAPSISLLLSLLLAALLALLSA